MVNVIGTEELTRQCEIVKMELECANGGRSAYFDHVKLCSFWERVLLDVRLAWRELFLSLNCERIDELIEVVKRLPQVIEIASNCGHAYAHYIRTTYCHRLLDALMRVPQLLRQKRQDSSTVTAFVLFIPEFEPIPHCTRHLLKRQLKSIYRDSRTDNLTKTLLKGLRLKKRNSTELEHIAVLLRDISYHGNLVQLAASYGSEELVLKLLDRRISSIPPER